MKSRSSRLRAPIAVFCAAQLLRSGFSASAGPEVVGAIAGNVSDKETGSLLSDVRVEARSLGHDKTISVTSDADGNYRMTGMPADIYSFSFTHEGLRYQLSEKLDVRTNVDFLLESCFALDRRELRPALTSDCSSGLAPEALIATIGPHRFLRREPRVPSPVAFSQTTASIHHAAPECIPYEKFPLLEAHVESQELLESTRVYFRSDKYADYYFVELAGVSDRLQAVLPMPLRDTERIVYYFESVTSNFLTFRTEDYELKVVDDDSCGRDAAPAWFAGSNPEIVVGATEMGASAVPPGFQALGIAGFVSASGVVTGAAAAVGGGTGLGLSTGLVIVVAGAAAAAAFAIGAGGASEDEASNPR